MRGLPGGAAAAPSFLRAASPLRALLPGGSPYTGTPLPIPGVIQAEDYDVGGEGVAYHDTTAANEGNSYRTDGVDISSTYVGPNVGWTQTGEWLEYTVNVAATSTYKIEVIAATPVSYGNVHVEFDGLNVTGNMPIPNTGAWGAYGAASKSGVLLTAGTHVMRVGIDGFGFLFDRVQISNEQTPYGGTAWPVPGTIQAEDFDNGGEGVAYHDTTTANEGNSYRATGVDITNTYVGPNVGWTQAGEWLEYTVNVAATGTYTLQAIAATPVGYGVVHFEIDGVDVTGPMAIPNTGGWGNYSAATKTGVNITAGQHVLKVGIDGFGFLFDAIRILPPPPTAPSGLTATAASTTQINLAWTDNSSNETGFKIERKTGAGGTYAEVTTVGAGVTSYSNTGLASNTQYFYRVRATNTGGDSAYSNEASAATANQPPTVSLTAPASGSSYTAPATVTLTATASDADGGVAKVEFYQGAVKLGEDTTSPYSYTWSNVPAGSHSLTARAIDVNGVQTTSAAASITVALPTVTVTATDAGASEQGPDAGTFTFTRAGASGLTGTPLTVYFTPGGTATGGGTDYTPINVPVTIPAGATSQTVTVTPVDDNFVEQGGETVVLTLSANAAYTVGTPASATVTIADNDTTPPSVSITSPTGGASFTAPATINITANASDPDPGGSVAKVEFFQGATKLGEDTSSPYAFIWSNVTAGSHSLTAKATDNNGAQTTSAAVSVTVSLPTVTVTATDASASEQGPDAGTFTIARTAGTGSALTVNYTVGGSAAAGTDYTAPGMNYGTHSGTVVIPAGSSSQAVTVTPTDDGGVETGGETVVLTLSNNAAYTVGSPSAATLHIADNDTYPPTASITSPAGGTVFTVPASIEINATAADSDGVVAKVEFFRGATKLGEDTGAPYSFTWVNPAAGSYSLTAKATDNAGATGASTAVSVVVNTPPAVSITSPAHNSTVNGGASVQITAAASDPDQGDSVTKVEFYAGATKLGEDAGAPYSFTWQNVPEGTHLLTAVATDTREASATSALVSVSAVNFDTARLDPENRTGVGGVDPYSRNFNWSLPLVSLPGRAGLDLGLSLSYNSLVWTKSGNYVLFDGDGGWPAPGFRLGFPVVRGQFYDAAAQKAAYMLVTPSGARTSLRYVSQTATTKTYEAADSSYLQLTEEADGSLTLVAPGGTRTRYEFLGGVFKCTEVRDRNGNFITVAYNPAGNIQTVTDTLGRVITFNYDADGYLKEITQTWRRETEAGGTTQTVTETHYWARFTYAIQAVDINFDANLTPLGAQDGQSVKVLKRVTLDDDSYVVFNYTTWGQVYQVANYAKDTGLLKYISLGLPLDATQPQGDCPRPTERRDWAAYWNGDTDGAGAASEEAVTTYDVTGGQTWQTPENGEQNVGKRTEVVAPDGTVTKVYSRASGWDEGLVRLSEVWSGGKLKKRTSLAWTQDDENVSYELNPRVKETNVYDFDANESLRVRRRTGIDYTLFGLPQEVKEYDDDATTVMRRTRTDYAPESVNADGAYTLLRIIGLPKERKVYGLEGGQEKLASKQTFYYDGTDTTGVTCLENAGAVAQQKAGYGTSFTTRGNLCLERRWDVSVVDGVSNADNVSKSVPRWSGYSTTGSVLFTMDALEHKTSFSYTGPNGAGALAYPTTITDPEGDSTTLEYNYDTGATTRKVDPKGAAAKTFYDAAGRTLKARTEVNGAYTEWEYGASGLYVTQRSLVDAGKPTTFVMNVTDGAGRTRGILSDHPTGGTGYAATRSEYDKIGRLAKRYNRVEVTVNANDLSDVGLWVPTGIDSTPTGRDGWPKVETVYDWNGRVAREINADGTDRLFDYAGCGCAGGDVATAQGELLNVPGTPNYARRAERVTRDALGREVKTEALDWYGATYAATTTRYNALNQPVRVRQYKGAAPSTEPEGEGATYQTTTMSYDGHGRLQSQHRPEQVDANGAPLYATYQYYADDTVSVRTDARGATTTYTYNKRHQVKLRDYEVPSSGAVATTPDVGFGYDAAGNRVWMTDGAGRVDYVHDTLSRMTSEKRTYASGKVYELKYEYNLADKLTKLTDPMGASVNYEYNRAGQLSQVTGADYGAASPLLTDISYRAWGEIKHLKNGDTAENAEFDLEYNTRGRLTRFEAAGRATEHEYYDDGRPRYVRDLHLTNFNRTYEYDHAGRLSKATAGESATWQQNPYSVTFGYDEYNHSTTRSGTHWSKQLDAYTATYVNNRNTQWHYDADGYETNMNLIPLDGEGRKYDAEGRLVTDDKMVPGPNSLIKVTDTFTYDGDGKQVRVTHGEGQAAEMSRAHYVYSTVLGGSLITEFSYRNDAAGTYPEQPFTTHIYAGGREIAYKRYNQTDGTPLPWLYWVYHNPVTSTRLERQHGDALNTYDLLERVVDPLGSEVFLEDPYLNQEPHERPGNGSLFNDMEDFGTGCYIEGTPAPCTLIAQLVNEGAARRVTINSPLGLSGLLDLGLVPSLELETVKSPLPPGVIPVDGQPRMRTTTVERLRFQFLGFMNQNGNTPQVPAAIVQNSIAEAERLLQRDECFNFVRDTLGVNAPERIGYLLRIAELVTHREGVYVDNGVEKPGVHAVAKSNQVRNALEARVDYRVDYYKSFFVEEVPKQLERGRVILDPNAIPMEEKARSLRDQGQDTLHEGIHLWTGKSDIQLANLFLKKGDQPFTDKGKASDFWHKKLKERCH
jgi:YD repeat-containing protein